MSDVALLLGPVVFRDFEIPSRINFGGRQRLAVHRLPGGARVIDALGRDDGQISFSGIFAGSDAPWRARLLDELRVSGLPLPLTWDVFFYTVLISDFRADYRSGCWIPYRVICTVVQDEVSVLMEQAVSLASAALADVGAGIGYAANAGLDLSGVQMSLATPGSMTRGTTAYTAAQSGLMRAQSAIDDSLLAGNSTLAGVDLTSVGSARDGVAGLNAATDASGSLSSLSLASAYIRRSATNLANAST